MADGAWIGHGTGIRALARKKKKELKRRETGGSGNADFRLGVHTSQQECAPQEKNGKKKKKAEKKGKWGLPTAELAPRGATRPQVLPWDSVAHLAPRTSALSLPARGEVSTAMRRATLDTPLQVK